MTECERIISQGILPVSFFSEEEKCDYLVTKEKKKIWAIELDLLIEFDRVCRKYGLRYWLAFGSLLGSIRHKGFIPWDDDTDVFMLREDYEKLFLVSYAFKHPYFFQTPYCDDGYFYAHARLRNTNTTFVQRPFCHQNYNMGVFLDILPLDNFSPDENGKLLFNEISQLLVDLSTSMKLSNMAPNKNDLDRIAKLPKMNPLSRWEKVQSLSKTYNECNTDYLFPSAALPYGYERSVFSKKDFEGIFYEDFEGYKFPVPSGYEHFLKCVYGEYEVLPSKEKRGTWHGDIWFDAEKSYKEVKKNPDYIKWSNNPNY